MNKNAAADKTDPVSFVMKVGVLFIVYMNRAIERSNTASPSLNGG